MGVHAFADLPRVMEQYRGQIVQMVTLCAQRAALAGGDWLASETPVDTGVARSNWIMSVDGPLYADLPAYFPYPTYNPEHSALGFTVGKGKGGKSVSDFSRKDETANLDAVRVQHSLSAMNFNAEKNISIHVTNSTPHIALLNEGRSRQTDPGFFERSVDVAKKAVIGTWRLKAIP